MTAPSTPEAPPRKPSNLQQRVIAGIVMIAVALAALILGGLAFWLLASVAALLMMAEWADLHAAGPRHKRLAQFALSVPLAIMAPIASGPSFFALGLIAAAFFFIAAVTRRPALAFGVFYVGVPVFSLLLLRNQANGVFLTLWAMALVWATDIGGYFAGRSIGGPKLAPRISPSKTWAGLIGGVALAAVLGFVLALADKLPWHLAAATPFLAALAQVGDLYESTIKRRAGVKDSGNILPGHGGVLDRLDGVVPVAPVAALLVLLPQIVT